MSVSSISENSLASQPHLRLTGEAHVCRGGGSSPQATPPEARDSDGDDAGRPIQNLRIGVGPDPAARHHSKDEEDDGNDELGPRRVLHQYFRALCNCVN